MNPDLGLLVLRVVVGGVVAMHGLMKLGLVGKGGSVTGTAGFFNSLGLRPGILWALATVTAEAGGAILTILGLGGPIGPGLVAANMFVVTIVAHVPQGFWVGGGKAGWEFPLPLAAGAFAIALVGNGTWSLDTVLGLTYPNGITTLWLAPMFAGAILALVARALFAPKPKKGSQS